MSRLQQLIEKYISGQSTPGDLDELRRLLKEPGSSEELERIMDAQLGNTTIVPGDFPEVADRIKKTIEKDISEEQGQQAKIRRLLFRRWAAAAAIVLLAGTAVFFQLFTRSSKNGAHPDRTVATNDITPGKEGAVLTLSDGRTVVLDSLGNGIIANQNGTQIVLRNGQLIYNADNESNAGMAYNTITTPRGRKFQVVLPDQTRVWLNAASSLRYPILFTGKERKVEITGEAYFEVTKNAAMPFRVQINNETMVEVLGTHFNINSYANESDIKTTLLEGSVRIITGKEKAVIKPAQQARISRLLPGTGVSHPGIKVISDVNTGKVIAWKDGAVDFQDATLEEVMRQLERWYDIEVVYEKDVPEMEFIGKMDMDLSLSKVLKGLALSEVNFRIEGRRVIVLP